MVTLAPGIPASCASATRPAIVPRESWASAAPRPRTTRATMSRRDIAISYWIHPELLGGHFITTMIGLRPLLSRDSNGAVRGQTAPLLSRLRTMFLHLRDYI